MEGKKCKVEEREKILREHMEFLRKKLEMTERELERQKARNFKPEKILISLN